MSAITHEKIGETENHQATSKNSQDAKIAALTFGEGREPNKKVEGSSLTTGRKRRRKGGRNEGGKNPTGGGNKSSEVKVAFENERRPKTVERGSPHPTWQDLGTRSALHMIVNRLEPGFKSPREKGKTGSAAQGRQEKHERKKTPTPVKQAAIYALRRMP